jgi:hypothetical protein
MEVYGFTPNNVFSLLSVSAVNPVVNGSIDNNSNNHYDYNLNSFPAGFDFINNPDVVPYNNSYIPIFASAASINKNFPNWLSPTNTMYDLRGFYLSNCGLNVTGSINGYCQVFTWPTNYLGTISTITNKPVAFTT